jgi:hypothetical protein
MNNVPVSEPAAVTVTISGCPGAKPSAYVNDTLDRSAVNVTLLPPPEELPPPSPPPPPPPHEAKTIATRRSTPSLVDFEKAMNVPRRTAGEELRGRIVF